MPWSEFWDPETPLTFSYPDDWTLIWEESLQLLSPRGSAMPEYHAAISPMLGESFLVAMPGRDSVVAAAENDIDSLSRFAAADFENAPFALTPELFRCSPGKLEPASAERGWLGRLFGR
jgi:hypothetical protein